ncbi:9506_t:CDS:2, partial [Gigaspora rosea]
VLTSINRTGLIKLTFGVVTIIQGLTKHDYDLDVYDLYSILGVLEDVEI